MSSACWISAAVCHLSLSSTRKHRKWDPNHLRVNMKKCCECLQCWQGVCSLTCKSCRWQIDSGCVASDKGPRTDNSPRDGSKPCSHSLLWCCYVGHYCFTAFSFIVKAVTGFAEPWKIPFNLPLCACVLSYMCVSVSQRPRYSIRTERWQRASKGYKKPANQRLPHTHSQTHTYRPTRHTHSEKEVFSWHSEQLSGLKKEEADRKQLLKQRKASWGQRRAVSLCLLQMKWNITCLACEVPWYSISILFSSWSFHHVQKHT